MKLLMILLITNVANAQNAFHQTKNAHLKTNHPIEKVESPPRIDLFVDAMESGDLDQLAGKKIDGFIARTPTNGEPVSEKTLAYLSYDKDNIYSVFLCYDSEPEKIRSTLAMRDEFTSDEDSVALQLITFSKSQQMVGFQSNAKGSQNDGIYVESSGWSLSYDPIWYTETKRTSRGFIVKITVPLSTLRFPAGDVQNWDYFLYRGIPRKNEETFSPAYSTDISGRLIQAGRLENIDIQRQKYKFSSIPFITSRLSEEKGPNIDPVNSSQRQTDSDAGLDAKLIWDGRLVLDLTLNPDFSQVESDEPQVVTNQRFDISFPEKRPFFIENSSFFETPLNLLFTRKIVDPSAGIRLTGQVDDWSIAAMVIDDEALTPNLINQKDSSLFYVANIRKFLYKDSFIGLYASNYSNDELSINNFSIQSRLRINDNWIFNSQIASSNNKNKLSDIADDNDEALYFSLSRSNASWNYEFSGQYISDDFIAPVGFIQRRGITDIKQDYNHRFLTDHSSILAYELSLGTQHVWNTHGSILDRLKHIKISLELPGQTFLWVQINQKNERLTPIDYAILTSNVDFKQNFHRLSISSFWFSDMNFSFNYLIGDAINYQPVVTQAPRLSDIQQAIISTTYHATSQLKFQGQYIHNFLDSKSDQRIFTSRISRLKTTYQFNRNWSLRLILDHKDIESDNTLSTIENRDTFVQDLLLTWEPSPGTAMYLGFGDFNNEIFIEETTSKLNDFINEEKQRSLFLKISYLFD